MIGGELSAVEKSLQFEAAFQGKLLKRCDDGFNGKQNTRVPESQEQLNVHDFVLAIDVKNNIF